MKIDKINILEGNWIDRRVWSKDTAEDSLYHTLSKIKTFSEIDLPISHLFDDAFWGALRSSNKHLLGRVDFRHWTYSDEDFYFYAKRIASVEFPAIILGDSPYGYERPSFVDDAAFTKKLFERMGILSKSIKAQFPKTKIVSPSVCIVDEPYRSKYLDFFIHNRNLFDVYSLNCAYDMQEQSTAILTAFLNQVVSVLPKETWVTRWSVPSSATEISGTNSISSWTPFNFRAAESRLKTVFADIESITSGKAKWFFTGCTKDDYDPFLKVSEAIWKPAWHVFPDNSNSWNYSHFMGLVDCNSNQKEPIIKALLDLYG